MNPVLAAKLVEVDTAEEMLDVVCPLGECTSLSLSSNIKSDWLTACEAWLEVFVQRLGRGQRERLSHIDFRLFSSEWCPVRI